MQQTFVRDTEQEPHLSVKRGSRGGDSSETCAQADTESGTDADICRVSQNCDDWFNLATYDMRS